MKTYTVGWLALVLLLWPRASVANDVINGWIIVVSDESEVVDLSQKQVMSFFLGRARFLPSGLKVKAFDFPTGSPIRAEFYQALTGKNIADIDAYWARLLYSGRASPPQKLDGSQQIINALQSQTAGIAYLPNSYQDLLAPYGLKAVLSMRLN